MQSDTQENDPQETGDASGIESEQYRLALHRYLSRRLDNAHDAQDLAQEAYMRFLQVPHVEAVRQPRGYLYRIAVNLVYEFRLRRDRSLVTYDSQVAEEQTRFTTDLHSGDPGEQLGLQEQLARVLTQIPPTYRQVLLLAKRDGLSYAEIAARMQITAETARKYLARAIAYGRLAQWDK